MNARNRMWSFWVDAANKTLADHKDELRDGAPYSEDSPEWKQFSVTLTAPAGAVKFRFEVRTYKGTTTVELFIMMIWKLVKLNNF